MVLWNILAGAGCFIGGFFACIGLIWFFVSGVDKIENDYDEYDY